MQHKTIERIIKEALIGHRLAGIDDTTSISGKIVDVRLSFVAGIVGVRVEVENGKSIVLPFDQECVIHFDDAPYKG